jgi:hypothetical protein
MHIVIYGVGRSGTKAVQLYLSYLFAKRDGNVWINYEPYFWLDRKTKAVSFEGFYHHTHSPHFAQRADELPKRNIRFLNKLTRHSGNIVTKFIRGNGRINAINEIFRPDHTLVIIRDLYQVLHSVMKTEWDFWSVGWEYLLDWEAFVEEIRRKEIIENLDWCLPQIHDRMDQNAFYWYTMNVAALKSDKNYFWLHYRDINKIEEVARAIFNVQQLEEPFRSPKFSGEFLHRNYPLKSQEHTNFRSHILNQVLYKSQLFKNYGWFLASRDIGSSAHINKDYFLTEEKTIGTSIVIQKRDLYEYFIQDIEKRFDKVIQSRQG